MKNSALGLIETYGFVGAVEAADAALKAAEVFVVDLVKVKGGIMTLTLQGEVSAVKASVDAGAASAERLGVLLSSHVIPRLDEEVWPMVLKKEKEEEPSPEDPVEDKRSEPSPAKEESEEEPPVEPMEEDGSQNVEKSLPKQEHFTKDMMEKLKVVELRRIARGVEGIAIPKNQIKFANKETLLKEIIAAQERRGKS
ncbi:BMC domain-containing protein [Proteiniclasticum ruminis]|uniref:Energy-coupling factor transport system substrate-specific component n=1 Tax=Proteiniclasticum ruminis TaxID=398199 RepID=A0A1I4XKL8_9CLOT|nr:BMC domain-containing protein [Proteiniclasticum ruminis]SFN26033.1 energy-coupling factor transport system substrate-specific component [Proteiniclasticum ruminis]